MRRSRAVVITNGEAASENAVRLILNLAAPLSVQSIHCLFVDSGRIEAQMQFQTLFSSGENAIAGGCWQSQFLNVSERCPGSNERAISGLKYYRSHASARGVCLTGEHRPDVGTDAIIQLAEEYDLTFYGLSRGWDRTANGLSPLLRGLMSRGTRPVILSHPSYSGFKRIVVTTRGDTDLNDLLRIGADWSECLNLPLAVVSAARTNGQLDHRLRTISRAAESFGICIQLIRCLRSPLRLAEALVPTDLLFMGAHGRPWAIELCFGSHTEELVRTAPCPIVILPSSVQRVTLSNYGIPSDCSE